MFSIYIPKRFRASAKLSVTTPFVIRRKILRQNAFRSQPALSHISVPIVARRQSGAPLCPGPPCSRPSHHVNTTGSECRRNLGSGASLRGEREGAAALCDGLSSRAYLARLKPGNLLRLQRGFSGSLQGSGAARQLLLGAESSRGCHMLTSKTMPTHLALAIVRGKADSKHIWPLFLLRNAAILMQKHHVLLNSLQFNVFRLILKLCVVGEVLLLELPLSRHKNRT